VQAPTLVVFRAGDLMVPARLSRTVATGIPGARALEVPGDDHLWLVDHDPLVDATEEFLTGRPATVRGDRVLATVMFTDIVGSTKKAADQGDQRWGELVARHHEVVRTMLARYRGAEVDTAGDGFFATFDGPARAVRCAQEISAAVRPLGLEIRAGVHTGEVQMVDGKIAGIAVVIGARVGARAGASEVLVSQTVKDLVAGSGLTFEDAGEHELKGVPDRWHLYQAVSPGV
jgi:class 3 adenylate cyclase